MGTNTQVCWHKFVRYWDVEERPVPLEGNECVTDPERAAAACDENTIGVVSVLGSTFTGDYENVERIERGARPAAGEDRPGYSDPRGWRERRFRGAVSCSRTCVWDFRLPRVKSINTSGHKYGLVFPGVGWVIWREAADLHPDLIFNVDYLGGTMPTLAINFSRPASQVVAQYYNLIRLGKSGYRAIHQACQDVAVHLARQIGEMGPFELLSDGHGSAGVRVDAEGADALVAVRSGGPAARPRLAGAGLSHARQPAGSGGAARGGAQRVHVRSGRHAGAGYPAASGLVCYATWAKTEHGWDRISPLNRGTSLKVADRFCGRDPSRFHNRSQ